MSEWRKAAWALLVAAALPATAGAQIPDDDGVFHACYERHRKRGDNKGEVRLVRSAEACRESEIAVAWGAEGPEGPPGESVAGRALPEGDPACPFGGALFFVGDEVFSACNGAPGLSGARGESGPPGPPGPSGPAGPAGSGELVRWGVVSGEFRTPAPRPTHGPRLRIPGPGLVHVDYGVGRYFFCVECGDAGRPVVSRLFATLVDVNGDLQSPQPSPQQIDAHTLPAVMPDAQLQAGEPVSAPGSATFRFDGPADVRLDFDNRDSAEEGASYRAEIAFRVWFLPDQERWRQPRLRVRAPLDWSGPGGERVTDVVTVTNVGSDPFPGPINVRLFDATLFQTEESPIELGPGESRDLIVTFDRPDLGCSSDGIELILDDWQHLETVQLFGCAR